MFTSMDENCWKGNSGGAIQVPVPGLMIYPFYPFNAAKRARDACGIECEHCQKGQQRQIEKGLPCHECEVTRIAAARASAAAWDGFRAAI